MGGVKLDELVIDLVVVVVIVFSYKEKFINL